MMREFVADGRHIIILVTYFILILKARNTARQHQPCMHDLALHTHTHSQNLRTSTPAWLSLCICKTSSTNLLGNHQDSGAPYMVITICFHMYISDYPYRPSVHTEWKCTKDTTAAATSVALPSKRANTRNFISHLYKIYIACLY